MSSKRKQNKRAKPSVKEETMSEGASAMAKDESSKQGERVKMTMYVSKGVAKSFKKLAIDLERDYSELADLAFQEYVQNHPSNRPSD